MGLNLLRALYHLGYLKPDAKPRFNESHPHRQPPISLVRELLAAFPERLCCILLKMNLQEGVRVALGIRSRQCASLQVLLAPRGFPKHQARLPLQIITRHTTHLRVALLSLTALSHLIWTLHHHRRLGLEEHVNTMS